MKEIKYVTPEEAVSVIKSGDRVHLSSVAVTPHILIKPMVERGRRGEICDIKIQHLHIEGPVEFADNEFEGTFKSEQFFVGPNLRKQTNNGYADYIPIFLSETQRLIRLGVLKVNVVLCLCSPPDKHGFVSLGTSVDATLAAIETADTVIAAVNPNVPRTFGDTMININDIDIFTRDDSELQPRVYSPLSDTEKAIGKNVAALVEDGACLQMGIGGIPNAVMTQLYDHKNLGLHTEMFADGVLPLIDNGVINGKNKNIDKGRVVASFLLGSKHLYEYIDNNPMILMKEIGYTNDVNIISKLDKMTAINSAISIDLTGQVCADSIGTRQYSGVGGQIDFVRGSSMSKGGKSIIAMASTTKKGVSKIAPILSLGSGVCTTRSNMHWLVTEYGAVDLFGKTLQDRAKAIISIAHPSHREELDRAAFNRFGPHFHYIRK